MANRVLIVDDHDGFRTQARELLEAAGYEIVGEAVNASSARTVARAVQPDVILLDVQLPDGNGFDLVDELGADARVVMISGRDPASYRGRLATTAAAGFIPKAHLSRAALDAVLAG
jgi:DNA-binding NarL/FixJ family response regulator